MRSEVRNAERRVIHLYISGIGKLSFIFVGARPLPERVTLPLAPFLYLVLARDFYLRLGFHELFLSQDIFTDDHVTFVLHLHQKGRQILRFNVFGVKI